MCLASVRIFDHGGYFLVCAAVWMLVAKLLAFLGINKRGACCRRGQRRSAESVMRERLQTPADTQTSRMQPHCPLLTRQRSREQVLLRKSFITKKCEGPPVCSGQSGLWRFSVFLVRVRSDSDLLSNTFYFGLFNATLSSAAYLTF